MKALTTTLLLAGLLAAGCAGMGTGAPSRWSERELCEQSRGPGVWVEAAGACIRGGGGS